MRDQIIEKLITHAFLWYFAAEKYILLMDIEKIHSKFVGTVWLCLVLEVKIKQKKLSVFAPKVM